MPAWAGRDIRNQLGQTYGVPVFVDNDANLGALAELWWGAGRDGSDLVYVKVGTGVGAGFIINGDIYRGSAGFAGEIGHVVIDPSSDRQLRGLRGCLAAFVGAEALERRAAERLGGAGQPEGTPCTVSNIAQAALHGDPIARAIVEEAGRYLGIAVVNLLNLTNPATVVLGGPITRTGEIILRPIHETVRAHTLWRDVASSRVVTSELGERAIAIGAATQVLKAALDTPSMFPRIQVRRKGSPV